MRVRDIMITAFDVIQPETTLREAASRLRAGKGQGEGGMPSLLVMQGGRLVGIVTLTDLLTAILPSYIAQDPHLAHLAWDGLLEMQCKRVQDKPIREIMTKKVVTINEDSVLTEAAEMLFAHHIHSLPVMRGKEVVGILYLSDLARDTFSRLEGQNS